MSRTLPVGSQTLPCGLRVLGSVLDLASARPVLLLDNSDWRIQVGQIWVWSLAPQTSLPNDPFLLSLPTSSPDEPLKWQYVDQFVSESGVRARTTGDGSAWGGLQGGQQVQKGGLALGMCLQELHTGPQGTQHVPMGCRPSARPSWCRHPAPHQDRMAIKLMWGQQCLL